MRGFLAKLCKKNGIVKRIFSMALAVLMMSTTVQALPAGILTAHAATSGDITLHYHNANSWTNVNAYVWDSTGATLNGTWPGTAITDTDSDGWYDVTLNVNLSDDVLKVIFNDGSKQTGDIVYTVPSGASELWIAGGKSLAGAGTVTTTKPTGYSGNLTLHFDNATNWNIVGAYIWDSSENYLNSAWPGTEITDADSDGWYDVTLNNLQLSDNVLGMQFNNGSGGDGYQTGNIAYMLSSDITELWITGGISATSSTVSTSQPVLPTSYNGDVTLHYQNSNNWSTVNAYIWKDSSTTLNGSWPGAAISANIDNTGWYDVTVEDIELSDGLLNFIFNDGSNQTADLSKTITESTNELWVSGDGTISTTAPDGWKVLYDVILHCDYRTKGWSQANVHAFDTANNNAQITEANWPGNLMTDNQFNDGWADYTLDDITASALGFVFSDNSANQTGDLTHTLEDRTTELWVTGDVSGAKLTTTAPTGWKLFATQTLKLHYYNANSWNSVAAYLHADGSAVSTAWPGTTLTQEDTGSKWYTATISDIAVSALKVTMNDGGAEATADKDSDVDVALSEEVTELWLKNGVVYEINPDLDSPIIKGNEVTFNYKNETSGQVWLRGSFDGWGAGKEMTDPDGDGVVSCTLTLAQGTYEYKFELKATGAWIEDPWNENKALNEYNEYNSVVKVAGLSDKTIMNVKKGVTYTLPAQLDFVTADGTKSKKDVTYELKNSADSSFVTLNGNSLTPKTGTSQTGVELIAAANVDGTDYASTVTILFLNENAVDTNTITLKVHYTRADGVYTDWNLWAWSAGMGGKQYDYVYQNGEYIATITGIPGRTTTKFGFINRKGDWKGQDFGDQWIDLSDIVSGTVHYYTSSSTMGGTRKFDTDTIAGSKIVTTSYDRTTNKVTVNLSTEIDNFDTDTFAIKCTSTDTDIAITDIENTDDKVYVLTLGTDISSLDSLLLSYTITYDNYTYTLTTPNVYGLDEFETAYAYDGDDLGLTYTESASTFKVWAPTADAVQLNLYASGTAGTNDLLGTYAMTKGNQGVWSVVVSGDLNGTYYTYTVDVANEQNEVCDPYARTTGVNGKRAMVLDLDDTDPVGWDADANKKLHEGMEYTDAVIYELHIRDLSIDSSSGVSSANQGKFLGLTETGTTTANGQSTALDHMIDLGITHLHLIPVYDYGSVDETKLSTPQFNWGYDPVNYNVPEGSYSTDPYNGEVRVKEMKQMIQTLHDNNINVVMDVVYNHVYDAGTFSFNQIVPKYFSRTNDDGSYSNGSGCGNDTASERAMVRKYIVDSILYWHEEYHIDGFRFDLVGLIDTVTIQQLVDEVHAIDPDIIFYGEGWTMGTAAEPGTDMATQTNSNLTDDFAFFNDRVRNGIAGKDTDGYGFIWGNLNDSDATAIENGYLGKSDWCQTPSDTVNYVSCHDNYTLMDKINVVYARDFGGQAVTSYSQTPGTEQVKLNNLAAAYYMFSMGIPLVHAGEDMLRTKLDTTGTVIHNSYNSPDYVNQIRWSNLDTAIYADTVDYYKGIIEFRKNHESLRLSTPTEVSSYVSSYKISNQVMMYSFDAVSGEVSDGIITIYNAGTTDKEINIYDSAYSNLGIVQGDWYVCVNAEDAGTELLAKVGDDGKVTVSSRSAMALVKIKAAETANYEVGDELIDTDSVYTVNNNVTVTLDQTTVTTGINAVISLEATVTPSNSTLKWESDNTAVATVDQKGHVTTIDDGTATITVSTLHGVKATCVVTVDSTVEVPKTITIDEATISVVAGTLQALSVVVSPIGTPVTYTSSDESVALVDASGNVIGVKAGTATITATLEDGQSVTCDVTVTAAPPAPAPAPSTPSTDETTDTTTGTTTGSTTTKKDDAEEEAEVETEVETDAATEVPDTVTEVTPVVDKELQEAVKKEAEKVLEDILNEEIAEDVLDEETLENVKEAQKDGEGIITEIIVETIDESTVDANVKDALEKALTDSVKGKEGATTQIAQYLDLSVLLKTTSGQELGKINKLSKDITFTIAVPEDLVKEGRVFVVLRMHEGETTVLETTMNQDGTLSFKTDRFSTYALAYIDMPVSEDADDEGVTDGTTSTGSTTTTEEDGGSNLALFIVLGLVLAGLVIFFIILLAKKRKKDE